MNVDSPFSPHGESYGTVGVASPGAYLTQVR